jgi:uncharacterized protein
VTAVLPPPSGPPRPIAPPRSRWDVVPPNEVRWGIPDAIVVLALFPVSLGLGIGYLVLFPLTTEEPFNFIHAGLSYLLLLAAIIVVSRWRGQRSLRKDFGLAFKWIDLPIGIGLAVLGKIASIVFGIFAFVVTGSTPKAPNFQVSDDLIGILLTGVLVATLLGPIVEELLMRGLVLRSVRYAVVRGRRHSRPQPAPRNVQVRAVVLAILINSAVFAALHLYQAPGDPALFITLALGTVTVGILHSIITIVTGRLGAAIVSHILFNGSSVVLQVALAPFLG